MLKELNQRFALGDQLQFERHASGLLQGRIQTPKCIGSFFLQGGHVASFQAASESQPVLFMSEEAVFELGKPIRGGIPICFPWFGPLKSDITQPSHGLVRTAMWDVIATQLTARGVLIKMGLSIAPYSVLLTVTFGEALDVALTASNTSPAEQACEVALHTYFQLGDARQATLEGLENVEFCDQLTGKLHPASGEEIRFNAETDRVYRGSVSAVAISDPENSRRIMVKPRGSQSTVVWNPWIAKSARLTDFGDQEFERMCCVETANVSPQGWVLGAGESQTVGVEISVTSLN